MAFFRDHSLLILLTISGIFSFFWFMPFREKLKMSIIKCFIVTVALMLWGFVSSRWIFPYIEVFGDVSKMARLRMYGIIYLDAVGFFAVTRLIKTDTRLFFDVCAISLVFSTLMGRLDCLVAGCCCGVPFFNTGFRWPIREIELITNVGFLAYYIPKLLKGKTHGEIYPIYLIYYGVIRFFLESFRMEGVQIGANGYHLAHIWSVISILIGVGILLYQYEKNQLSKARPNKVKKR